MVPPEDPDYHPTATAVNLLVNRIGKSEAETIVGYLEESDASLRVCQIRVLGGALGRVQPSATAYAHRKSPIMLNLAAFYGRYSDLQVSVYDGGIGFLVGNAASSISQGIDAEFEWQVARDWRVSGNLEWLDFRYDETAMRALRIETQHLGSLEYSGELYLM